jgi:spermidine synthase
MQRLGPDPSFFAAGFGAVAAQVLLLRELVVDVAGDELAIGVGLAIWLLGIALGAAAGRRRPASAAPRDAALGMAVLSVLPVLAVVGGRLLRSGLGPGAGELPGLGLTLLIAVATLAPPGTTVGWTFATLAASASRFRAAGEAITALYVTESLGSLVGGLAVTLLVGPLLSPLRAAALFGALAAALTLLATRRGVVAGGRVLAAAAGLCGLALGASGPLDAWSERARFAGIAPGLPLEAVRNTPYQHLALGDGDGVWHLYAGGQYAASFPDPYGSESRGHLVASLAPRPARVLVLGGVEQGLVRVLLDHPVHEILVVEPDRQKVPFVRERLGEGDRAALADHRVRLVYDDPRRFLARSTDRFGLVLALGPDPVTLLRARLRTVEFFRQVAAHLEPDGVVVTATHTAPSALVGETFALAGSLFGAMREALPVVRATPGPDTLLVAGSSAKAVTLDPGTLARRWDARGITVDSFGAALFPVLLPPGRVADLEAALAEAATQVAPSRDDRPASFVHALARRQQTTAGRGGRTLGALSRLPVAVLVLLALLPSLLTVAGLRVTQRAAHRIAASAASHAVAVTGAAGMGFSLLLLLSFQSRAGALYGALGALTAVFMFGLALGALLAQRAIGTREVGATSALRLTVAAALAYALALPWTLDAAGGASGSGLPAAVLAYGALLAAAGLVTGAPFPVAAAARLAAGDGAGEAAGRLESADHLGAAVSALVGAILFIPTLGFNRSAWMLAALLALALVGLPRAARAPRDGPTR